MSASWLADKIEQWPTAKLLPYARNARTHSDEQVAQIAASIAEFGFTNPILAGADGVIVAGHGRLAAAHKLGLALVPVVVLHDISHAVANALKRQLATCPKWTQFMTEANTCNTKIRQTVCAFLMPPELKNKSRWMNLEPLVEWSNRVQTFPDNPCDGLKKAEITVSPETIQEMMDWLRKHEESIVQWSIMMEAAGMILKFVRLNGYHQTGPADLEVRRPPPPWGWCGR